MPESPGAIFQDITDDQFAMFEEIYKPLEDELLGIATNENFVREGLAQTRTDVGNIFDAAQTGQNITQSRFGLSPTGRDTARSDRSIGLRRALSMAQAENTTRLGLAQTQKNVRSSLVNTGRGLLGSANQGIAAASSMESARVAAHEDAKQQARANNRNMWGQITSAAVTAGTLYATGGTVWI